jgi:hypothetical protein
MQETLKEIGPSARELQHAYLNANHSRLHSPSQAQSLAKPHAY